MSISAVRSLPLIDQRRGRAAVRSGPRGASSRRRSAPSSRRRTVTAMTTRRIGMLAPPVSRKSVLQRRAVRAAGRSSSKPLCVSPEPRLDRAPARRRRAPRAAREPATPGPARSCSRTGSELSIASAPGLPSGSVIAQRAGRRDRVSVARDRRRTFASASRHHSSASPRCRAASRSRRSPSLDADARRARAKRSGAGTKRPAQERRPGGSTRAPAVVGVDADARRSGCVGGNAVVGTAPRVEQRLQRIRHQRPSDPECRRAAPTAARPASASLFRR